MYFAQFDAAHGVWMLFLEETDFVFNQNVLKEKLQNLPLSSFLLKITNKKRRRNLYWFVLEKAHMFSSLLGYKFLDDVSLLMARNRKVNKSN